MGASEAQLSPGYGGVWSLVVYTPISPVWRENLYWKGRGRSGKIGLAFINADLAKYSWLLIAVAIRFV